MNDRSNTGPSTMNPLRLWSIVVAFILAAAIGAFIAWRAPFAQPSPPTSPRRSQPDIWAAAILMCMMPHPP